MSLYTCSAIDKTGQRVSVDVDSADEFQLEAECSKQGLTMLDFRPSGKALRFKKGGKGVLSSKQIWQFLDRLYPMVAQNIPNTKCMEFLANRGSKVTREIAQQIMSKLADRSLADAMTATHRFPPLVEGALRAGDQAADLPATIEMLSRFYQMKTDMSTSIFAAMVQPALAAVVSIGMVLFNIMVTVPKMTQMVTGMGYKPHGFLAFLGAVAGFLRGYWYLTIMAVVGIALFLAVKSAPRDAFFEAIIRRMAMFRNVVYGLRLTALCYALHILYKSNMPTKKIFDYLIEVEKGTPLEKELRNAAAYYADVSILSQALEKRCPSIEPEIIYKLQIGEQTSGVPEQMLSSAITLERGTEMACKNLAAKLVPFVLLFAMGMLLLTYAVTFVPMLTVCHQLMSNSRGQGGH
jgi:general secretion pathway protein F